MARRKEETLSEESHIEDREISFGPVQVDAEQQEEHNVTEDGVSELGRFIQAFRKEKGWSRSRLVFEIARQAGVRVAEATILNLETGKSQSVRNPKVLGAFETVLGVPRDRLVSMLFGIKSQS